MLWQHGSQEFQRPRRAQAHRPRHLSSWISRKHWPMILAASGDMVCVWRGRGTRVGQTTETRVRSQRGAGSTVRGGAVVHDHTALVDPPPVEAVRAKRKYVYSLQLYSSVSWGRPNRVCTPVRHRCCREALARMRGLDASIRFPAVWPLWRLSGDKRPGLGVHPHRGTQRANL